MRTLYGCGACARSVVTVLIGASALLAAASASRAAVATADTPAVASTDKSAEGLEEVIVTAQFRKERLQDTPIAITAVTDEMMRERSQESIYDVTQQAPNVEIKKGAGPEGSMVSAYIRGIGQSDFNFALEPGVGMYLDDVYFPTMTGSAFEIVDLERVEVLRGPQGTLEGRNSIGGAVRLISKEPTGEGGGYASLTTGSFSRIGAKAAGEFTLSPDKLFLRITGATNNQDGYVQRLDFACDKPAVAASLGIASTGNGRSGCDLGTLGGQSWTAGRAILRWLPLDGLEVHLTGDITNDKSEAVASTLIRAPTNTALGPTYGPWFVPQNRYATYETFTDTVGAFTGLPVSTPPINYYKGSGVAATVEWQLAAGLSIKSITAHRQLSNDFATATDGSPLNGETGFNDLKGHSFQQELRLNGSAKVVDYTAGLWYFTQKNTNWNRIDIGYVGVPFDFISDEVATTRSKAAFAHAVWHLFDKFDLTTGLRYSNEYKSQLLGRLNSKDGGRTASDLFAFASLEPSGGFAPLVVYKDKRVDYRVSVDYKWTDHFMTYATTSTGFKGGGVSPRFFFASHIIPFKPETLKAYEAGFKTDLLANRLRINAAYFINDYTDVQGPAPGGVCPNLVPTAPCLAIFNTTNERIQGAELEISFRPTAGLLIDASGSEIQDKYTRLADPALLGPYFNYHPDAPPGTPHLKFSAGIQQTFTLPDGGSLTPRFDANYESKIEPGDIRTLTVPSYTVMNARVTWRDRSEKWEASAAVTNLADKYYWYAAFDITTLGAWASAEPAPPRQWSLTARRNF